MREREGKIFRPIVKEPTTAIFLSFLEEKEEEEEITTASAVAGGMGHQTENY